MDLGQDHLHSLCISTTCTCSLAVIEMEKGTEKEGEKQEGAWIGNGGHQAVLAQ